MVYLVAVNHSVQFKRESQQTKQFIAYLREKIKILNIALMAEEWSNEASKTWKVATSTVEDLANELEIPYQACDLGKEERSRLGIGKEDFSKRENYWHQKIRDKVNQNILFICGTKHISTFNPSRNSQGFDKLLKDNGWNVEILPEQFSDEENNDDVSC
jgi:hypothetical protein